MIGAAFRSFTPPRLDLDCLPMSTEKTEGLVIRQTDFSETSKVVTFFTRDWGKISVIAKGARRLKGPFEAAIDLLTACRIVFIRKSTSSLDILTEAQLETRFKPNSDDMTCLYGGYYVAELLQDLTEEYDPHPRLYDEAVLTLNRLAKGSSPQIAVLRFELTVLREIGQLPLFDECIACGTAVANGETYGFWVSQGGLICRDCGKEEYQRNPIHAGTVAVLRRLASPSQTSIDRLAVSPAQQQQLRRIVTSAISHTLGHRPRMFRYLNS